MTQIPRLAFLVDAENVSETLIPGLFEQACRYGDPVIRRAYASYASEVRSWRSTHYADLGITPVHVPAVTKGKNAADIALAVDAMEIALRGRVDVVCIVSSDGDFTFLGHKLREGGVKVIGMGDYRSPTPWQGACDVFINTTPGNAMLADISDPERRRKTALRSLEQIIADLIRPESEIHLSTLGQKLIGMEIDFEPKRFGASKLRDLIEGMRSFDIRPGDKEGVLIVSIREKPASKMDFNRPEAEDTAEGDLSADDDAELWAAPSP